MKLIPITNRYIDNYLTEHKISGKDIHDLHGGDGTADVELAIFNEFTGSEANWFWEDENETIIRNRLIEHERRYIRECFKNEDYDNLLFPKDSPYWDMTKIMQPDID